MQSSAAAPFDPNQLLNALSTLLSPSGGIKSIEEVPRLSSLMKKFSKKLVSRCIYCHVLQATAPEVISLFLDQDGWSTINSWILEAKETNNTAFLKELVDLCSTVPMTLERLKENNTAKLIKSLSKSEDEKLRKTSEKVVTTWMKLIKGAPLTEKTAASEKSGVKKKRKKEKEEKVKEEKQVKLELKDATGEAWLRRPGRKSRTINDESISGILDKRKNSDSLEDVDVEVNPLINQDSNEAVTREPRPKTVKTFHAKFRSTGLIEENPLPKGASKKGVDKGPPKASKRGIPGRPTSPNYFPEKKIKPSSLITPASEGALQPGGIKLIAPKPRPTHVLHESAGFMDALVSVPAPIRKKKRSSTGAGAKGAIPTSPTTPPPNVPAPKLEFYKDTLDLGENENKEDEDKTESEADESKDKTEEEKESASQEDDDEATEKESQSSGQSGEVKSILMLTRKRGSKKKSVKWVEDAKLKEFFYFDLDENERVNVNNIQNFGDLKSQEMKRERQVFENAKRLMGDKMEEIIPWRKPHLFELPHSVEPAGANSKERDLQEQHQNTTLQELYFSKDMIPDTPHEPDPDPVSATEEPIAIPLEDLNNPSGLMDYSSQTLPPPKATLPPVLNNLLMSIASTSGGNMFPQAVDPMGMNLPMVLPDMNMMNQNGMPPMMDPSMMDPNMMDPNMMPPGMDPSWMGGPPPDVSVGPPEMWGPQCPPNGGEWMGGEMGMPPPDGFMGGPFQGNMGFNMPPMGFQGPMPMGGFQGQRLPFQQGMNFNNNNNNNRGNRGMRNQNRRGNRGFNKNGQGNGDANKPAVTPRVPCKHFQAGSCRFGPGCSFLHPGINGPVL